MISLKEKEFFNGFLDMCELCCNLGWNERNGGNMSYRIKPEDIEDVKYEFKNDSEWQPIGIKTANLADEYFMVTGSGKYFRYTKPDPDNNVCIVKIDDKGENYKIVWGLKNGGRPTSEFPTHLINHSVKKAETNGENRVILHCHPVNTVSLTFVLPLDDKSFTRELWAMMPECSVVFPEGVGVAPWEAPGSLEMAYETSALMKKYNIVIWPYHGIMCAGEDFKSAFGLMETVEKAANMIVKIISMGGKKHEMTNEQIKRVCDGYNIKLNTELL